MMSHQEERAMGLQAFQQIMSKEKISRDARTHAILQRVGRRISAVAEAKHRVGYDWKFTLIESDQKNAFCLPGGKVAFYTGMLNDLQNEAALAIVMGHEASHAIMRHGAQRSSQGVATGLAMNIGTELLGLRNRPSGQLWMAAFGLGAQVGVVLPFSRNHESEADVYGLEYAAKAGYDPREAARFWSRFGKDSAGGNDFFSTHPASSKRVQKLKALEAKAMLWYKAAPQKFGRGESLRKRVASHIDSASENMISQNQETL